MSDGGICGGGDPCGGSDDRGSGGLVVPAVLGVLLQLVEILQLLIPVDCQLCVFPANTSRTKNAFASAVYPV